MIKKPLPRAVTLSYAALVIANLIWAAAGPIIKLTISFMPPFTFLFFRFSLVCILILPFTIIELAKTKVDLHDYWKLFVLGLFSQSSIIFVVFGLKYTTATDMAIIGSLGVLLSMAAGHYFFNEKMNNGVKVGTIIALVGTVIVILEPLLSDGNSTNPIPIGLRIWGNVLVFLNNIFFLLYIVWSKISFGESNSIIKKALHFIHLKPMATTYSASLITSITFYVGLVSMLPFTILENLDFFGPINFDITQLHTKAILGLLYMAVLSSIVAYFFFEWALDYVTVGDTAILGYISTIFGIPFAFWILGEIPSSFALIGAAIIGIGVTIAEVAAHYHKKRKLLNFEKL